MGMINAPIDKAQYLKLRKIYGNDDDAMSAAAFFDETFSKMNKQDRDTEIHRMTRIGHVEEHGETIYIENIAQYCRDHYFQGSGNSFKVDGISFQPPFTEMILTWQETYPEGDIRRIKYFLSAISKEDIDDARENEETRIIVDVARNYGKQHDFYIAAGNLIIGLDKEGHAFEEVLIYPSPCFDQLKKSDPVTYQYQIFNTIRSAYLYVLFTIAMMHCKNVDLMPFEKKIILPKKSNSKKKLKDKTRQKKTVMEKYYVLQIEPMKKVLSEEGNIEHEGLERALHICRGHFRTYDEKPLFGKIKGTFWVPQHMRGKAENGIIHKDYDIKLPTKEE